MTACFSTALRTAWETKKPCPRPPGFPAAISTTVETAPASASTGWSTRLVIGEPEVLTGNMVGAINSDKSMPCSCEPRHVRKRGRRQRGRGPSVRPVSAVPEARTLATAFRHSATGTARDRHPTGSWKRQNWVGHPQGVLHVSPRSSGAGTEHRQAHAGNPFADEVQWEELCIAALGPMLSRTACEPNGWASRFPASRHGRARCRCGASSRLCLTDHLRLGRREVAPILASSTVASGRPL